MKFREEITFDLKSLYIVLCCCKCYNQLRVSVHLLLTQGCNLTHRTLICPQPQTGADHIEIPCQNPPPEEFGRVYKDLTFHCDGYSYLAGFFLTPHLLAFIHQHSTIFQPIINSLEKCLIQDRELPFFCSISQELHRHRSNGQFC